MGAEHPAANELTMEAYLASGHIWVSKTGIGVGTGMSPKHSLKLGRVDEALAEMGHKRHISVFTRHYQVASFLTPATQLIATMPSRAALLWRADPRFLITKPPFPIVPI